jgi:hypothetical protein
MNSSGIKRGLATTAVSALAVAGIPFIATSASAAPGDTIRVASIGPVLDGGNMGGIFRLQVSPTVTASQIALASPDFASGPNSTAQSVALIGTPTLAATDSNPNDGLTEYIAEIRVTTNAPGSAFEFGIFENDDDSDSVGDGSGRPTFTAGEARTTVTGTTAGPVASINVSPTLQSAPLNTNSGDYTASLRDSAGRLTQLRTGESVAITKGSGVGTLQVTPSTLADEQLQDGSQTFVAQANQADLYTINLAGPNNSTGTASLDVAGQQATGLTQQQVDVVTGADTRDGFNQASNTVDVRPDQSAVTFNIDSPANAGRVVTLTATAAGGGTPEVTFGGQATQTRTTTLNAQGVGSVTFNVDAGSIQDGDTFNVSGNGLAAFAVNYEAPEVQNAGVDADATVYLTAFKGTTTPTVTVEDQYGNPATGTFVSYQITSGPNAGAESARVAVNNEGKATFSITDANATAANNVDNLTFRVYAGQFAPTPLATDAGSSIRYTADGTGNPFLITVDSQTPGGTAYNPVIQPLTDTTVGGAPQGAAADSLDEAAEVRVVNGTTGVSATVTVDNGARVLLPGETRLSQGQASRTAPNNTVFRVVGTQAGTVNITVTSGGVTRTGTLTVQSLSDSTNPLDLAQAPNTARNIAIEGPDGAVSGDVVEFVVTITDAFGNPVRGFSPNNISTQLLGPAELEGNSGNSNAAGEITYTVELDQDAARDISLQVTGQSADFGAAADRLTAASTTNDGQGLTASVNVATAEVSVVDLGDLEEAVERAEAELAAAQADLAAAQADLDVAQTQLAIAQGEVDRLQERKQNLRQKLNKAKANDNKKKAKTTRKKLRNVKSQLRDARQAAEVAQTAVEGEQAVVAEAQQAVTEAEEALAQAQADLEEAQN